MGFTNPYPASRLTVDSTNSLAAGLAAWFPLTDGLGTTIDCIVHAGHTATQSGGVSWASTDIGTAASFDGVDDYFNLGTSFWNDNIAGGYDFSINAWFYVDSTSSDSCITGSWGYEQNLIFWVDVGGSSVSLTCIGTGFGFPITSTSAPTVSTGNWHMGTLVADNTAGTATIYLNGVSSNSVSYTASLGTITNPFGLGSDRGGATFRQMSGDMQNIRFYSRALSATEVTTLYHRPWEGSNYGDIWPYSPPASASMTLSTDTAATSLMTNCVGWWPLTTGTGTVAKDIVGTNDGTMSSSNVSWATTGIGTAADFVGTSNNGHFDIATDLSRNQTAFSCSAWIKPDTTSFDQFIFYESNSLNVGHTRFGLRVGSGSRIQCCGRDDDGDSFTIFAESNTSVVSTGDWQHAVAVFDPTGNGCKVFLDGVDVTLNSDNTGDGYPNTASLVAYIGGLNKAQYNFDGQVSNVRVWNRALTADEVTTLYARPWEGIEYGDTFHYDPPAPASMLPLTSDSINQNQELWYPLTDGSSTTAVDISGGGNDATLLSAAGWATSSLGTVLALDGQTNSYATTPLLSSSVSHPHTHSVWFRTSDTSGYIIHQLAGTSGIFLRMNSSTLEAYAGTTVALGSANQFNDNQWHNVVAVFNDTSSAFYVDGVLISSSNPGTRGWAGSTIGARSNGAQILVSDLQNYRVWSRALTADEVWSIYANPWLGSNYKLASGSTPLYNYIFRTERFRRLG